jgi:hypothetical protein
MINDDSLKVIIWAEVDSINCLKLKSKGFNLTFESYYIIINLKITIYINTII